MVLVDKEVEAEEVGGLAGGRAEQDMGRVRQQGGAGFRPVVLEVDWGWGDTDKMPPKSPFVSD